GPAWRRARYPGRRGSEYWPRGSSRPLRSSAGTIGPGTVSWDSIGQQARQRMELGPTRAPYAGAVIVGVGIDVVDVDRFARILSRRPALAERLFTPAERRLPIASLAARFAAKEAVAKALGAPAGL